MDERDGWWLDPLASSRACLGSWSATGASCGLRFCEWGLGVKPQPKGEKRAVVRRGGGGGRVGIRSSSSPTHVKILQKRGQMGIGCGQNQGHITTTEP